jgi:hypothetical protein
MQVSFWVGTADEQQGFHFFQSITASDLFGFAGPASWGPGILQASHYMPAIRYALTALGSLHQQLLTSQSLLLYPSPTDKKFLFALDQCNQSINSLLKPTDGSGEKPSKEIILVACLLYCCFSSLQGNEYEAINHLRGGLKILAEEKDEVPRERSLTLPFTINDLRPMFISLDTQAKSMLPETPHFDWPYEPADFVLKMKPKGPLRFESLLEAYSYIDGVFNALLTTCQAMNRYNAPHPSADLLQMFSTQFAHASSALEEFLSRPTTILDEAQRKCRTILRIYQSFAECLIRSVSQDIITYQTIWDSCEHLFLNMVSNAAEFLEAPELDELVASMRVSPAASPGTMAATPPVLNRSRKQNVQAKQPTFSCRFGILQPLFMVAVRSRHPIIRRKAIALLLHYPRREGLWDGVVAGRIAYESMMTEEEACEEAGIQLTEASDMPEMFRVRDIRVELMEGRSGRVNFRTMGQFASGDPGYRRTIDW